jgi:plasmid maintenance system antidote protein VapI
MTELQRVPTHPGEILKEEFLVPYEMSLKLSKYFGTTPQLWLNLQNQFDLYKVAKKKKDVLDEVKAYEKIVA